MKLTFPVIIQKHAANSIADCIIIPALHIRHFPSDEDIEKIRDMGLNLFLTQAIINTLVDKEENNEDIELPGRIDSVLEHFLYNDALTHLDAHDVRLNIEIDFRQKRKCHCCTVVLPPLTKLTILAEITAGTILTIGTLQLTEGGLIPMNPKAFEATSITQAVLSALFDLWLAFSGPGIAFMSDFGAVIDDSMHKVWRKITCGNNESDMLPDEKNCNSTKTKIRIVQTIFVFMVINNLWTGITDDYVELDLLQNQLEISEATLFPNWLISAAAWTAFGFNQLNDPIEILSLMIMGFKLIAAYYIQKPATPTSDIHVITSATKSTEVSHSLTLGDEKKYEGYKTKLLTPSAKDALRRDGLYSSRGSRASIDAKSPLPPNASSNYGSVLSAHSKSLATNIN